MQIIAILASMLLPALSHAKTVAKQSQCQNLYKQYGMAMTMYLNDYGWLPPAYNSETLSAAKPYSMKWGDQIESYLTPQKPPSYLFAEIRSNFRSKWACTAQKYGDFLAGATRVSTAGYNINIWMSPKLKNAKIAKPSQFMLLGDSACDVLNVGTQINMTPVSGGWNYFSFSHGKKSVLLHGDMHVSTCKRTDYLVFVDSPGHLNYSFWIP